MRPLPCLLFLAAVLSHGAAGADDRATPPAVMLRPITSHDRVLILAPHPDDESLGAAGLIQKAVAAHARVRVVFATDGDANPWAQRLVEHRAFIGKKDRARWGARRKQEACRALAVLGVPPRDVIFLDLPDQGTTRLLMANDKKTMDAFRHALGDWQPTIAAIPSRCDLHADHNACFVFARLALGPPDGKRLIELEYLVHKKPLIDARGQIVVKLSPSEVGKKRAAILCHTSQTALSRRSLAAFAQPEEMFYAPGSPREFDANNPVALADARHRDVFVQFHDMKTRRAFGKAPLLLVGDTTRQTVWLPRNKYQHFGMTLPRPTRQLFLKLDARGMFLDKAGWREVPVKQLPHRPRTVK